MKRYKRAGWEGKYFSLDVALDAREGAREWYPEGEAHVSL